MTDTRAIRNRIHPYTARAMLVAAVSIALAACGNSVVITAQSSNSTSVSQVHLTAGTYSIKVNDCTKPYAIRLLLALQDLNGQYLLYNGIALQDGGLVTVSSTGMYGVLGLNTIDCHPAAVTFTLK